MLICVFQETKEYSTRHFEVTVTKAWRCADVKTKSYLMRCSYHLIPDCSESKWQYIIG
jgi:hypothetical protein